MPRARLSSIGAPTSSVFPSALTARLAANQSCNCGLDALRNACSVHVPPLRTQTYAAPAEPPDASSGLSMLHPWGLTPPTRHASSAAPATMVLPSPLMAIEKPSASLPSEREPLRYASCRQSVPVRLKT